MKLLKYNTQVKFGEDNMLSGKITAISMRETHVLYEISYWKADEFKTIWLSEKDMIIKNPQRVMVGFES